MKKFLLFLVVAVMALALVACSGNGDGGNTGKKDDEGKTTDTTTINQDVEVAKAGLKNVIGQGKLYLTTFGQAGFDYAKQIVDEAVKGSALEGNYTAEKLLTADQVSAGDVVIAVLGYTTKGIDTKTITVTSESARAEAFAKKDGITLIVMQLEGKARRGESSDPIISAAVAGADYIFVYEDNKGNGANYDSMYTNTWAKDKLSKYYQFSDEFNIYTYLEVLLK